MSITLDLVRAGAYCTLHFLGVEARCPARTFYDSLQPVDQKRSKVAFRQISDWAQGHRRVQVRFIGFWDGPRDFVITNGFFKHRSSETRREIETALRLQAMYLEDKEDAT